MVTIVWHFANDKGCASNDAIFVDNRPPPQVAWAALPTRFGGKHEPTNAFVADHSDDDDDGADGQKAAKRRRNVEEQVVVVSSMFQICLYFSGFFSPFCLLLLFSLLLLLFLFLSTFSL